jgi:hypothetical protein
VKETNREVLDKLRYRVPPYSNRILLRRLTDERAGENRRVGSRRESARVGREGLEVSRNDGCVEVDEKSVVEARRAAAER